VMPRRLPRGWQVLAAALALALATPGIPAVPAQAAEPVELEAGQAAPFKGSLCDKECASRIVAKIEAANQMRDRCYDELKVKPSSGSSLFVAGLAGAGFVAGLVVGGIVVAKIKK
jgi:hypothetical protein